MNSQKGDIKQSDIEKMMNKFSVFVVMMLLVMALVLAIIGGYWYKDSADSEKDDNKTVHFYIEFGYD